MIQYAGKLSENPYYIKEINKNVYSLEEINYFVYNHMNLVYRDFFCDSLFDYIENELKQKALARQLRVMDQAGASVRDFITYLLKESCYYDPQDLSKISGFVMNIDNISEPERRKIEGDNLFKERRYNAAKAVYLGILNDEKGRISGEFYADIAFSAGLCCANLFLCKNACTYFHMAYDIFPKDIYAKACVYLSIVLEDEEELLKAIIRFKVSDEALERIRLNVEGLRKNILHSEEFARFSYSVSNTDTAQNAASGYKDEYYRMTE